MAIDDENSGETLEAVDRGDAAGSIGLVVVIALTMVAAVVSFLFIGREDAEPWVIGLLALLAVMGVFALFAVAAGILQFAGRAGRYDLTKALVDEAADGTVVVDPSGRVLYANTAYLRLSGATSADDVVPVERLYSAEPEMAEAIYRLAQEARAGRAAAEEVRAGRGGEAGRWLRLKVRPAGSQGRLAKAIAWSIADVTGERLRQENAYVQLQQVIDYLDHCPAGFFSAEPDGDLVYINATLAEWLGYEFAEVAAGGLKLSTILSGPAAVLLTSRPGHAGDVKTEVIDIDLKRRSGESLPVRLYHKVTIGADGTPGPSRTLVLDRSRGGADTDLARAAEVRFSRFFNSTPMAIATVDRFGRIARVNALFARLFGGGPVEVRPGGESRTVLAGIAEADRPALEAAIKAAAAGKGDIAPVDAAMPGDRSVRVYVVPVEESERDQETAIVYAIETTQQRALEAQVAQSQKMTAVGQLAGGVAHDFNNVLTAIIGHAEFLLESHRPTDPSFQDIMQIKHNANRAAGLVRQLLAFSRRQTLRPRVIRLSDEISELTMLLKRLIGETVSLDMKHGRDLWPVYIDDTQFGQVVVNLAVNARDAMPKGGKLTIRTANVPAAETREFAGGQLPAADFVLVEVTDTGTGMPPEIIDKIFDPFFTTKEIGKGTGLGLSTVYGIVKQTGGYVYCDSKVGVGTTFRIFLPRHVAAEIVAAVEEPAPPAKSADLTGRGTILLVEDEDSVRAFGSRALSSRGYTVLQAPSGAEALELFESHDGNIDLVVSDVVMPEMDGPTLLRELRRRRPGLKVIFVSGYAEDAFRRNLPEGEQFAFLPKPFTLKQLIEAVKDTLAA